MTSSLSVKNHDRDAAGMRYVYPVISRRAGGVSVGVNLNPNNACNWRCVYCQVPDLQRGVAPVIDLKLLRVELQTMLADVLEGDFMLKRVPESCRKLCDVAISGNGEATSCAQFDVVVRLIVEVMQSFQLQVPLRLISNGSYVHKRHVQQGLALMAAYGGEVWIKVDTVSRAVIEQINGVKLDVLRLRQQVEVAARQCPTWIQTCMFGWDGSSPLASDIQAYLDFLQALRADEVPVQGVLLYGLARPSLQVEAVRLHVLDAGWMKDMASRIQSVGFEVKLSV